jgi:large subunit ribosomal protein L30
MAKLRITLVRSGTGRRFDQKRTIEALGLRKLGHTVEHVDSPSLRGMITKIAHLVSVEEAKG